MRVIGKGDRERMVPLLQPVLEMLQSLPRSGELIFKQEHPDGITHRFQALARACDIDARLHHIRHTCATFLLAGKTPITTVQAIMGHASVVTTQIYAKVVAESLKEARLDYGLHTNADNAKQESEIIDE